MPESQRFVGWLSIALIGISGLFFAHGLVIVATDALEAFGPGVVMEVKPRRGFDSFTLDNGDVGEFPRDVLSEAQGRPPELEVGDHVAKSRGRLTFWLNGEPLGGREYYVRSWLLGGQVVLPLLLGALMCLGYMLWYRSPPYVRTLIRSEFDDGREPMRGMVLPGRAILHVAVVFATTTAIVTSALSLLIGCSRLLA